MRRQARTRLPLLAGENRLRVAGACVHAMGFIVSKNLVVSTWPCTDGYDPLTESQPRLPPHLVPPCSKRPTTIALSRQNMPNLPNTSIEGVAKGAYIIHDCAGTPDVILMGTGSELQLAHEAAVALEAEGEKRI